MSSDIAPSSSVSNTPSPPPNLWSIMRGDYPDAGKATNGAKKLKIMGQARYVCGICTKPPWFNTIRGNARSHYLSHPDIAITGLTSSAVPQLISAYFNPIPSHDALRNIFNQEAYKEAIVGLLTV
jgi:hypothetical protein